MALRQPALLLADVDGTLVTPEKILTERAVGAVQSLLNSGIAFSIVSGRPPRGMMRLAESLNLKVPFAAFNGGALIGPDFKILKTRLIPQEIVTDALEVIQTNGLDDAWLYTENNWYLCRPDLPRVKVEQGTVEFAPVAIKSYDKQLSTALKIVGLSEDYSLVARCETELQKRLKGRASASRSQPYYVDVTHSHANKGSVVEDLCTYLKIEPSQVITIGDMPSDISMFEKSGLSIAMGNASDEVKRAADVVTESNTEDGFANAVEEILSDLRKIA